MQPVLAILLAAALVAGVSCGSSHYSTEVDLLDINALVDGVYSKANAEWFMKNSDGFHGIDCTPECRGFGDEGDCKGLHKTTCTGVKTGEKATVHTKMVFTCLGGYTFAENVTDDKLTMSVGCHGLHASHTFAGITKNVTTLPENCDGHCSKHHEDSHCSEHCPDHEHHSKFDAIVKSEATCGLTHSWSLDHPLTKGSTVSMESLCSGVSSFDMWVYGKKDIPAEQDMEAIFDEEAAAYDSADSGTIMQVLSSLATTDTKNAQFQDTAPSVQMFGAGDNETLTVTCNGDPAEAEEECEGEFEVVWEGEKDETQFKEDDVCSGKHMYFHGTYICEGTSTSERTDTCDKGKKVSEGVCDGKQLFSMVAKEGDEGFVFGFGVVCVGESLYDTATTPAAEEAPAKKEASEETPAEESTSETTPAPETEVAPATETETASATLKPIYISLKNIKKAIV